MLSYFCRRSGLGVVSTNPEFGQEGRQSLLSAAMYFFAAEVNSMKFSAGCLADYVYIIYQSGICEMFRTCSTLFYHVGHDLSIGLFSLAQVFSQVLLKAQYPRSRMSTFAKQNVGACVAAFSALFTYFAYPQYLRSRFFRIFHTLRIRIVFAYVLFFWIQLNPHCVHSRLSHFLS